MVPGDFNLLADRFHADQRVNDMSRYRWWPFSNKVDPTIAFLLNSLGDSIAERHARIRQIGFYVTRVTIPAEENRRGYWHLSSIRHIEATNALPSQYLQGRLPKSRALAPLTEAYKVPGQHSADEFPLLPGKELDLPNNEELLERGYTIQTMKPSTLYTVGRDVLCHPAPNLTGKPIEQITLSIGLHSHIVCDE